MEENPLGTVPGKNEEKLVVEINAELEELIPEYLNYTHQDLRSLREALANGDFEAIRILGHNLKGSGGGYGFEAITEIGHRIEQSARGREGEVIRGCIQDLSRYLDQIKIVYV